MIYSVLYYAVNMSMLCFYICSVPFTDGHEKPNSDITQLPIRASGDHR